MGDRVFTFVLVGSMPLSTAAAPPLRHAVADRSVVVTARPDRASRHSTSSHSSNRVRLVLPVAAAPAPLEMTDQVPNFTLPSQEARIARDQGAADQTFMATLLARVRKVGPIALLTVAVVLVARYAIKRIQENRVRSFQQQLKMLSLDDPAAAAASPEDAAAIAHTADVAKKILESSEGFKFRTGKSSISAVDTSPESREALMAQSTLDFLSGTKTGASANIPQAAQAAEALGDPAVQAEIDQMLKTAQDLQIPPLPVKPSTELETAVVVALEADAAFTDDATAEKELPNTLKPLRKLVDQDASDKPLENFKAFASAQISALLDTLAASPAADDNQSLANLAMLVATTTGLRRIGSGLFPDAGTLIRYTGSSLDDSSVKEDIYKRYAVYCLSSPDRVASDLVCLKDMQGALGISDATAEAITTEVAKAMFQVAASTAMADGQPGDEKSLKLLESLKKDFADLLDTDTTESIASEVGVMRIMYSLQQLIQDQAASSENIQELRKMCASLGVDVDEMLKEADALGDALGPEAKEFIVSLQEMLSDSATTVPAKDVSTE